jgi:hypothetical protein
MERLGELRRTPTTREATSILAQRSRVMQTLAEAPKGRLPPSAARRPLPEDEPSAAKVVRERGEGALRGALSRLGLNFFPAASSAEK